MSLKNWLQEYIAEVGVEQARREWLTIIRRPLRKKNQLRRGRNVNKSRAPQEQIDYVRDRLKDCVFLVEATHEEQHNIWEQYASYVPFNQLSGFWVNISPNGEKPLCITFSFDKYAGQQVGFYDVTSDYVLHSEVENFLADVFKKTYDNGHRRAMTNATNVGHCIHECIRLMKLLSEDEQKRIHSTWQKGLPWRKSQVQKATDELEQFVYDLFRKHKVFFSWSEDGEILTDKFKKLREANIGVLK